MISRKENTIVKNSRFTVIVKVFDFKINSKQKINYCVINYEVMVFYRTVSRSSALPNMTNRLFPRPQDVLNWNQWDNYSRKQLANDILFIPEGFPTTHPGYRSKTCNEIDVIRDEQKRKKTKRR